MPLFGPAIDDRTGAGREGRPRTIPLQAATLLLVGYLGLVVAASDAVGGLWTVLATLGGVALVGVAVALIGTGNPRETIAGTALIGPALLFGVDGLFRATAAIRYGGGVQPAVADWAVIVLASALVVAAGTWGGATGTGALIAAIERSLGAWLSTIAFATIVIPVMIGLLVTGAFVSVDDPVLALWQLPLLFVAIGAAVRTVLLPQVPVEQLVPRDRRDAIVARVERAKVQATYLAAGGVVGFLVSSFLLFAYDFLVTSWGPGQVVGAIAGWEPLRVLLVGVFWGTVVVGGAFAVLPWLRGTTTGERVARVSAVAGGTVTIVVVASYAVPVAAVLGGGAGVIPLLFMSVLVTAAFIQLLGIGWLGTLAIAGRLSPTSDERSGALLMGLGPIGAALLLGIGGGPRWLVFTGIAVGPAISLLAASGASLTREVGWRPSTRAVAATRSGDVGMLVAVTLVATIGLYALVATVGSVVSRSAVLLATVSVLLVVGRLGMRTEG